MIRLKTHAGGLAALALATLLPAPAHAEALTQTDTS
jgi:hypothetical protein